MCIPQPEWQSFVWKILANSTLVLHREPSLAPAHASLYRVGRERHHLVTAAGSTGMNTKSILCPKADWENDGMGFVALMYSMLMWRAL